MDEDDATHLIRLDDDEESVARMANELRGVIISHYTNVEFIFTDLIARALCNEEYAIHVQKLPYPLKDRIKMVRKILSVEGPISSFAAEMEPLLQGLMRYEQTRLMIAHGMMSYTYEEKQPDTSIFHFQRYNHTADKIIELVSTNVTLKDMADMALQIGNYSARVVMLATHALRQSNFPKPNFAASLHNA